MRALAPGFSLSDFSSAIEKKLPSLLEDYMISIKGIIDKVASRKLAVTAAAGAADAGGAASDGALHATPACGG